MCRFHPAWDPASGTSLTWQRIPKSHPGERPGSSPGCLWAEGPARRWKEPQPEGRGDGLGGAGAHQAGSDGVPAGLVSAGRRLLQAPLPFPPHFAFFRVALPVCVAATCSILSPAVPTAPDLDPKV